MKAYTGGNYSTDEVFTGKYWIDGKEIYRKVIDFGNLPNASTKAVAHGISSVGTIIRQSGLTVINGITVPIPAANPEPTLSMTLQTDSTNVVIITGANRSSYTAKVILEYTKAN